MKKICRSLFAQKNKFHLSFFLFTPLIFTPLAHSITITDANQIITVQASAPGDNNFLQTHSNQIIIYPTVQVTVFGTGAFDPQSNYTQRGFIYDAINQQNQIFGGKNAFSFAINTTQLTGDGGSMFFAGNNNATITFNSNLTINFTNGSNIGQGIFLSAPYVNPGGILDPQGNDQTGKFIFNRNVMINASNVAQNSGGYIFNLSQKKAVIDVNYNGGNAVNPVNLIQLQGNIKLNGQDAVLNMYLNNPDSFLVGREDYTSGQFNLSLNNGGKWIVTEGNPVINNLFISNQGDPNNNPFLQTQGFHNGLSMIDLATPQFNKPFTMQTITINTLSGNNGVFRTMVDIPGLQADLVKINKNSSGTFYLQLFEKPGVKPPGNGEIKVAEIMDGGQNLTFNALPAKIGLYDYTAKIIKKPQGNGFKWVIDANVPPKMTPNNNVQNAIYRLMTLQYRIFRIQSESINHHIDELVQTKAHHNFWANYYIGKQSYKSSRDNFQAMQGGYDYGLNLGALRQLVGVMVDYVGMKDRDTDFDGTVNNFGIGAYAQSDLTMSQKASINLDLKMKYNYSRNSFTPKNNLAGANFVKSYHLFFMGARLGSKINLDRGNTWFLEPSGNAGIGFISGGYINIVDQITQANFGGKQASASIMALDVNLAVGKRFFDADNYVDLRAGIGYGYNNNTGGNITFIDVNTQNNFTIATPADHRMKIFFSANASLNNFIKLYANFYRTFFSHLNTDYVFSFGVRISFGDFASSRGSRKRSAREDQSLEHQEIRPMKVPRKTLEGANARPLPRLYGN